MFTILSQRECTLQHNKSIINCTYAFYMDIIVLQIYVQHVHGRYVLHFILTQTMQRNVLF